MPQILFSAKSQDPRSIQGMSIQPIATKDDKWNGIFQTTMKSHLRNAWIPGPVIIGAGPSGLAVAACLKAKSVPFLILEKEDCIGSLWKLKTYDGLQLHLPKKFCELPFMPFPPEFPTYPTRQQFISYLEAYAKHLCIEPMFNQDVKSASYDATMGFWCVQANEREFFCRWLIVATGENAEPTLPDIPGISDFEGRVTHTAKYKGGHDFEGRRVLVVGGGNSGMEVSLDLCNSGAQVSLAIRDKLHILPRETIGKSTFAVSMWLLNWLPVKVVDRILLIWSRVILGDTKRVGIKRPEIGPLELKNSTGKTPVLDVGTFAKIKSGEIEVVRGIRKFTAKGAEFVDGKVKEFDSAILATGYRSNVKSWLKEEDFFNTAKPFPNNWKGRNGLYSVGFTKRALFGASIDAQKVAEDVARQWKTETRHLRIEP